MASAESNTSMPLRGLNSAGIPSVHVPWGLCRGGPETGGTPLGTYAIFSGEIPSFTSRSASVGDTAISLTALRKHQRSILALTKFCSFRVESLLVGLWT